MRKLTSQKRRKENAASAALAHGTSRQRLEWFRRGLESGDLTRGDTFSMVP